MKTIVIILGLILATPVFAASEVVVADFNNTKPLNNLGETVEVWLKGAGNDETQITTMTYVPDDAMGDESGHSLMIRYDVDSPNPAYNGVRTDLGEFDASEFTAINFYVKGDAESGFSSKIKMELIGTNNRPSPYIFDGVTDSWQKVSIPLSEFWVVNDWTKLTKFVLVFADIVNDPKEGTIYIDHIYFS